MKPIQTFESFLNESLNEAKAIDKVQPAAREFIKAVEDKFKTKVEYSQIFKTKQGFEIRAAIQKSPDMYDWVNDFSERGRITVPGIRLSFSLSEVVPGNRPFWPADNKKFFDVEIDENVNESYNESDAYKEAVNILKTLHELSNKIKFRVEDVNRHYNIVYDDPKGETEDLLKRLKNNKFWNTDFAPTTGKFPGGRINITFSKSAQEILNVEKFDKKDWSPKSK
jgi:hypothetical protein